MDASWFEPVAAYCERCGPGFWAEPLNAVSNGAFLIAAVAALRAGRRDPPALGLAALVAVIGAGSFLFHTLANRWSQLADVVPIGVFIHAYLFLALRRLLGLGAAIAGGATLAFAGVSLGLVPALDALTGRPVGMLANGSIDYLPALFALVGVAAAARVSAREPGLPAPLRAARRAAGRVLLAIAALFLVSLVLRTVDRAVCPVLPTGTHALWHGLNAGVLYALILVAIRVRARAADPRGIDPASTAS